jgi:predicted nucleic acid-binding Zn ribbon protein
MRCSKCGKWLPMLTKFCQRCGTEVPPEERKKAKTQLLIMTAFSLLVGAIISFLAYQNYTDPSRNKVIFVIVASGLAAAIIFWDVLFFAIGYVKFIIRRPVLGSVILGVILLLASGGYFVYWQYHSAKQFTAAIASIQDELNEAAVAKIMGDSIIAKKTIPGSSMARVKATAELVANRLEFMTVSEELADYQQSAMEWSKAIAKAADDKKTWGDLSDRPRSFQLKLSQRQSEKLFEDSIKKIAELKEFGDGAIDKKDRTTMLYIAAKLSVQEHWLIGILYSEKAGFLSLNSLVSPALALSFGEGIPAVGPGKDVTCQVCADPNVHWTAAQRAQYGCDTRCRPSQQQNQQQTQQQNQQQQTAGGQNQQTNAGNQLGGGSSGSQPALRRVCLGRGGISVGNTATNVYCIEDVILLTYSINGSATSIAQGNTSAQNGWNDNWHNLEGLGVISVGEPALSSSGRTPAVQQFYDDCQAKGGIVGGSGTVKAGLPTTESGYTCEYKFNTRQNGTQPCWDFLTYSGSRYMGGNTGCPAENLLPAFDEQKLKALGGEWDGIYDVSGGTIQCSGDFAYTIPIPATQAPVSNNIVTTTAGPMPIVGNSMIFSISVSTQQQNAIVSVNEIDTFRFYQSGNTTGINATYNATITISAEGQIKTSTCYGTTGGARQ